MWRIHLLEDDPSALASTADLLENAGFSVTASSNLMDAIDYVARSRPNVLILSLELPAVSIVRLFRDLGSLSPGTRVILTSVRSDWGAFEEAHLYGASSLVTKPIHPMSLLRAVERAMAGARGTAG